MCIKSYHLMKDVFVFKRLQFFFHFYVGMFFLSTCSMDIVHRYNFHDFGRSHHIHLFVCMFASFICLLVQKKKLNSLPYSHFYSLVQSAEPIPSVPVKDFTSICYFAFKVRPKWAFVLHRLCLQCS